MDPAPSPRTSPLGYAARAAVLAGLIATALHVSSRPGPEATPQLRTEAASSYVDGVARYQIRFPIDWRVVTRGEAVWVVPPGTRGPFSKISRAGDTLVERPRTFFVRVTRVRDSCTRCHNSFLRRYGWTREAGADVVSGASAFDGRAALAFEIAFPPEPRHFLGSCECVETGYWCPGCTTSAWGIAWSNEWYLLVEVTAPDEDALAAYRPTGLQIAVSLEPVLSAIDVHHVGED